MPEADPDDVRDEIDTTIGGTEIARLLNRLARDIDREYDGTGVTFEDAQHRSDFEAALAALRIATGNAPDARDRTASEAQTGRTSQTYEASTVARLRKLVRRRDPGDTFGRSSNVIRDTDRHISTSGS